MFRSYGYPDVCTSSYDTNDFTASEMCLACNGGVAMSGDTWYLTYQSVCVNTDNGAVNLNEYSCSYLNWLDDNEIIAYDCETEADTSEFTASSMCCACGGGETFDRGTRPSDIDNRCEDSSSLHLDSQNQSCVAYDTSSCGMYDNVAFNSSKLCCACGGGQNVSYIDDMTVSLNSDGLSCFDISQLLTYGFDEGCASSYDTNDFTASEMCLACGGGVAMPRDTWYHTDQSVCVNTDNGAVNLNGYSCDYLNWLDDNENIAYNCETEADTSEFTASSMCCACRGGEAWNLGSRPSDIENRCEDSSSLHLDSQNQSCVAYDILTCGMYDTVAFNSSDLCCVCGGGDTRSYVDTMNVSLNSEGLTCSDISQLYTYGYEDLCSTSYDTNQFTASELCVSCGGGEEMPYDTWYQTPGEGMCDDSMWNDRSNRMRETCDDYDASYCITSTPSLDDSDFTASEMCCACGGGEIVYPPICVDTSLGTVNADGFTCAYIQQLDEGYGCHTRADTSEFTATSMCCACGGGITWNRGSLPSIAESRCEDEYEYCAVLNESSCVESNSFDPNQSCCVCGGGRTFRFVDVETEHLNSMNQSCSDIFAIVSHAGLDNVCASTYDTSDFTSTEVCLACGGGEEFPCSLELLDVRTYAELQTFPEECTTIYGTLLLSNCADCSDLLPLSHVNEIVLTNVSSEVIRIENNEALVSLLGIEHLLQDELHGDVTIRQNRQLSSLSYFSNLHTIRGDVNLEDNTKLPDLDGFQNVHTITGDLTVAGNARLINIESLSALEHVGDITITRNPILDSIAGLRNLRTVGDIYIRGDGIVSIENVGKYLDFDVQRTYDVVITDIACINYNGVGAHIFRSQSGVDIPGVNWWDHSRCRSCAPACQENSACDFKGLGMCICSNSSQVGPNCGISGTIRFDSRNSSLVFDAIEPPIGYTRVETILLPIRRNTFSDNIIDVSRIPFHAIDLDGSDPTVDPFLSEYRWTLPYYDSSSQEYMQDGHLTIRIPISNDEGTRHMTEEIRVGMSIMSAVRYPDYNIAQDAQATVRI